LKEEKKKPKTNESSKSNKSSNESTVDAEAKLTNKEKEYIQEAILDKNGVF